jgi:hypothetical protein
MLISDVYVFLDELNERLMGTIGLFLCSDEMDLAVNILENLTEVPRFDTLIMFLSSTDKAGTHFFS